MEKLRCNVGVISINHRFPQELMFVHLYGHPTPLKKKEKKDFCMCLIPNVSYNSLHCNIQRTQMEKVLNKSAGF